MERKREQENNSNNDMQRKDECWTCNQPYEVKAKSRNPLGFLNKLVSKLGLFTEWVFGEIWVIIHGGGRGEREEKEPTIINKGFVPLEEATSTFLNYGKSFFQTYITRFSFVKSREKGTNAHKRFKISRSSNNLNMTKISLNNLTKHSLHLSYK